MVDLGSAAGMCNVRPKQGSPLRLGQKFQEFRSLFVNRLTMAKHEMTNKATSSVALIKMTNETHLLCEYFNP